MATGSCSMTAPSCWCPESWRNCWKFPAAVRSIPCGWPGIWAIATPTCRSSAIEFVFAAITCLRTCCAASAPRSLRLTPLSIPNRPRQAMSTVVRITMTDKDLQPAALYRLLAWLSPSFPVGAFSYSSGIEWAVEAGDIKDADTLKAWLSVILAEGGGYCDAVLFAHAHRAVSNG